MRWQDASPSLRQVAPILKSLFYWNMYVTPGSTMQYSSTPVSPLINTRSSTQYSSLLLDKFKVLSCQAVFRMQSLTMYILMITIYKIKSITRYLFWLDYCCCLAIPLATCNASPTVADAQNKEDGVESSDKDKKFVKDFKFCLTHGQYCQLNETNSLRGSGSVEVGLVQKSQRWIKVN